MTSKELTTAGSLLMYEVGGFVVLSIFASRFGQAGEGAVFIGLLAFNLVTAWFMAKAARSQGKSAILYGIISIVPPGAAVAFFRLWNYENRARFR